LARLAFDWAAAPATARAEPSTAECVKDDDCLASVGETRKSTTENENHSPSEQPHQTRYPTPNNREYGAYILDEFTFSKHIYFPEKNEIFDDFEKLFSEPEIEKTLRVSGHVDWFI
jgi:hypothetical protein